MTGRPGTPERIGELTAALCDDLIGLPQPDQLPAALDAAILLLEFARCALERSDTAPTPDLRDLARDLDRLAGTLRDLLPRTPLH